MLNFGQAPEGVQEEEEEVEGVMEGPHPLVGPNTVALRAIGLDVDMVFKMISMHDFPWHSNLVAVILEGSAPRIFPERPDLIHICTKPIDAWVDIPKSVPLLLCWATVLGPSDDRHVVAPWLRVWALNTLTDTDTHM